MWEAIHADFPILDRTVHNDIPLVYLDSAATSFTPEPVLQAIMHTYRNHNANVNRGVHTLATEITDLYEQARGVVANFVGAKPNNLVFVRNATEGLNLLSHTWAAEFLQPGDTLICTEMEHHANMVPWQMAAKKAGFSIEYVRVLPDGTLDQEMFDYLVANKKVKGLAVAHMSNVLGTINPIADMTARLKSKHPHAIVVADAAQSVPHLPINLVELGVDYLVFSGHKMLGPKGIGAIAAAEGRLANLPPFLGGGDMIVDVTLEGATYAEPPHRFEAGTPAFTEVIGLQAAVEYLTNLGMDAVRDHEITLGSYALEQLRLQPGVTVHGLQTMEHRGAVFSFDVEGLHPHDIGTVLDSQGVAVRAGHHCAKPLVKSFGRPSTSRASLYIYNTKHDIDALVEAIRYAQNFFGV